MTDKSPIEHIDLGEFKAIKVNEPGLLLFNDKTAYFLKGKDVIAERDKIFGSLYGLPVFPSNIGDIV